MSFDRPPSYQTVNNATGNVNTVNEEHVTSTANSSSVTLVASSSLSADPQGLVRLSWHPEAPQQFDNADDSHRIPFGAPPG
ncbi:hypothetical protein VKT23_015302 [Stygiomarasmius scandens]|uniref:Uncharacterized protein n=1 Tax=Marasmiellus scandens TaxID=2682957 RepID=A0ABR1J1B8_9AGAR